MRTTKLGFLALPDAATVEVQQYGANGTVAHRTVHQAAGLLAVNGKVAAAVRQAVACPGTVCRLEVQQKPRKPNWRQAGWQSTHKPRESTDHLSWQAAGWTE